MVLLSGICVICFSLLSFSALIFSSALDCLFYDDFVSAGLHFVLGIVALCAGFYGLYMLWHFPESLSSIIQFIRSLA